MDKIILTNGNMSISIDFCNNNVYHLFNRLVESIGNKKKVDTFFKPDGDWKRYEHRDANNELIQCSFWFI